MRIKLIICFVYVAEKLLNKAFSLSVNYCNNNELFELCEKITDYKHTIEIKKEIY